MDHRNNRRDAEGSSVLTANHLLDGRIVWLAADGTWQPFLKYARVFDNAEIEQAIPKYQGLAQQEELVGVYGVQVLLTDFGPVPVTTRELIRAGGPSSHPQFAPVAS